MSEKVYFGEFKVDRDLNAENLLDLVDHARKQTPVDTKLLEDIVNSEFVKRIRYTPEWEELVKHAIENGLDDVAIDLLKDRPEEIKRELESVRTMHEDFMTFATLISNISKHANRYVSILS